MATKRKGKNAFERETEVYIKKHASEAAIIAVKGKDGGCVVLEGDMPRLMVLGTLICTALQEKFGSVAMLAMLSSLENIKVKGDRFTTKRNK